MSLIQGIKEELKRSPITVVATVAGVAIGSLALLVAWLQYAGSPVPAATATPTQPGQLGISNLLLVLAFFLATVLSLASAIRLLARVHSFAAMALSVPAAVLASFGTMVTMHLVPPRTLGVEALSTAQDIVFWGTSIVFVALNGSPVLQDLARPTPRTASQPNEGADGWGVLALALFLLIAWGALVSAGLSKLVRVFLL